MEKPVTVLFQPRGTCVSVPQGTTVLQAIRMAGIGFESICGGKGECNKCKVVFLSGDSDAGSPASIKGLTSDEISRGYCRACQTHLLGDCEFSIPLESRIESPRILMHYDLPTTAPSPGIQKFLLHPPSSRDRSPTGHHSIRFEGYRGARPHMTRDQYEQLVTSGRELTATIATTYGYPEIIALEEGDTTMALYGIAVDIGTTTVAGVLIDCIRGSVCAEASILNQQIAFGEELLTRITAAKTTKGRELLRTAAVASVNTIIDSLVRKAGIDPTAVAETCIAGNTVMHYLLLGNDASVLEMANTAIPRVPRIVKAREAGLNTGPGAYLYCLPNVSRFVGGDAVGDVIASGMNRSKDISLLIDLGTNGEIILGNQDWLASVSCASGPAFEGAGMSCGMRAMSGAIDHVVIDPSNCTVSFSTIGGELPRGICGSGIIDTAAALVTAGIVDFSGRLIENRPGVRHTPDGPEFVLVDKSRTGTGRDIVITRQDLTYLMDSKAAACGAVGVLLKKYRLSVNDISHVYLAGGFGEYADRKKLETFGIIPVFPNATVQCIGNGSLSGACAALLSLDKRKEMEEVARTMVYIDLLVDADFIEEYTAALYIPGKEEYFRQSGEDR